MSQPITGPTLKQLCASQILSSGSHLKFDNVGQKFFEHDVLYRLWSDLKSCPQGVLGLQNEISKIERKYQNADGQFPADVKISAFFRELTQIFSPRFAAAGLQLGNLTPVYCHEYSRLQEIYKEWEDEALELIWREGILPQLRGPAPHLTKTDDMRNWLKNEVNVNQLLGVTRLELAKRKIKALPLEIRFCTQLTMCDFSDNQISHLPEGIFDGLAELNWVGLSRNKISKLTRDSFKGCTKLHTVFLNENQKISSVPATLFSDSNQLAMLLLSNTKVSCIPETLFTDCTQLYWLELMNNRISSLPEALFANCPQLSNFKLNGNQIISLPGSLLVNCKKLQVLSLDDNKIISLPETIFAKCASLNSVSLKGNPLLCVLDHYLSSCVSIKDLSCKNVAFNNYNCLSKLSSFVKLLSFGTESSAKIKDTFAQLERRDQCLIIEMFYSIVCGTPLDPQGTEPRIFFDDMYLFCCAVRKAILEKAMRMSNEESGKVYIEIFHLGKLEIMQNEEFVKTNCHEFDLLPVYGDLAIRHLGAAYADENVLLFIDAMDRVGL